MSRIVLGCVALFSAMAMVGCEKKLSSPMPNLARIEAQPESLSADDGVLRVRATLYENGTPLIGFSARLTLALTDSAGNAVTVTEPPVLETDALGQVTHTYSDLRTASTGTAMVEALREDGTPYLDRNDQPVSRSIAVRVLAGRATSISATLAPSPAIVLPGTDVTVATDVRDAWNNRAEGTVAITTDAPGALVVGDRVTNLEVAGSYQIAASLAGTSASDTESLTIGPGAASVVLLTASKAVVRAGESLEVSAKVYDAFGNEVDGQAAPVEFDVLGLAGETFAAGTEPNSGTFTGLTAAGSYQIQATLGGASPPTDLEPLLISPAAANSVNLGLSTPSVAPGGAVTATVQVRDAFSNLTTDPVDLSINAPGAVIQQGPVAGTWSISDVTQAGSYSVVAAVAGVPVSDLEPLTVTPGPDASIDLSLDAPVWDAGQTITGTARVYDEYGNEIVPPPTIDVTTTIPAPAAASASGNAVSVSGVAHTGTFQVTATISGTSISDPETVTVEDVTVPSITLSSLPVDLVEGASVGVNLDYTLTITAADTVGVTEIHAVIQIGDATLDGNPEFTQFYPDNTTNAVATPVLVVADTAPTGSPVQLVIRATDGAGNTSSFFRNLIVDPAGNLHPSLLGSGIDARTVAEDPTGNLRFDGFDCLPAGSTAILTLGETANDDLHQFVLPATGFVTVGADTVIDAALDNPSGVVFDPRNDDWYVMNRGGGEIFRYPAGGGRVQINDFTALVAAGRHLEIQTQGAETFLFVVESGAGTERVRRYDITTPPTGVIAATPADFLTSAGSNALWGVVAGTTNLFISARDDDRVRTGPATGAGGVAAVDFLLGQSLPQGLAIKPASPATRFASELFVVNNDVDGASGERSPIRRIQQDGSGLATLAHGIQGAADAAFCNDRLYVLYDLGDFDARVVEISGF